MKRYLIDVFLVTPIYLIQRLLLFLYWRGHVGALVHNLIYCALGKIFAVHYENKRKVDWLTTTITQKNSPALEWQRRVYTRHQNCWKRMLKNIFIYRLIVGGIKRLRLQRKGLSVPSTLSISPNTPGNGCNLECSHCFARAYSEAKLPFEIFHRVVQEQEELGLYVVLVVGGEPFMYDRLLEIFRRFPRTTFMVSTNGTLLTQEKIDQLILLSNAYPIFGLEGFQKETDAIRGPGVFSKVMVAMKQCKDSKLPYAATVTVTKSNFKTVTSDAFLEMLVELECLSVNYSTYVPIGDDAYPELVIGQVQSIKLAQLCSYIKDHFPIFPTVGLNGIGVGRCWAAREVIHITASGDVEPCPFVKWAAGNIKTKSILEIANSKFFKGVRGLTKTSDPSLVPCQAFHSQFLQDVFGKLGAHPTTKPRKEVKDEPGKFVVARAS